MKVNNKEILACFDNDKYVFSTLYSKDKKGKIMYSDMYVFENEIHCSKGYVDGKKTIYKPTRCYGKNKGKSNETSDHTQALLQAQSKYDKKINRSGYTQDLTEQEDDVGTNDSIFPMLAKKYDIQKTKIVFPCGVSEKLDGCRCISKKVKDNIILTSRTNKEFNFLNTVRSHISSIIQEGDVYDGELYSHTHPFNKIISIVRQKTKPSPDDSIMEYWIFDIPSMKDSKYENRMDVLKQIESKYISLFPDKSDRVLKFIYYDLAHNEQDIKKFHDKYINNGYEGAIIRILGGKYEFSRSSNLLKYKEFIDEEFLVTDVTEGKGSEQGAVIFVCETNNGDTFNVRPISSVSKRRWQYDNRSMYIGNRLTVRFQYEG